MKTLEELIKEREQDLKQSSLFIEMKILHIVIYYQFYYKRI